MNLFGITGSKVYADLTPLPSKNLYNPERFFRHHIFPIEKVES